MVGCSSPWGWLWSDSGYLGGMVDSTPLTDLQSELMRNAFISLGYWDTRYGRVEQLVPSCLCHIIFISPVTSHHPRTITLLRVVGSWVLNRGAHCLEVFVFAKDADIALISRELFTQTMFLMTGAIKKVFEMTLNSIKLKTDHAPTLSFIWHLVRWSVGIWNDFSV